MSGTLGLRRGNRIAVAFAAASATLILTACGGTVGAPQAGSGGDSNDEVRIAVVPKFTSLPYFKAVGEGAKEAGKELGVEVTYQGPVNIDVAEEANIIKQFATQKYDAISVSATDADAITPALAAAQRAGIKTSTWDADTDPSARQVFLNQVTFKAMGENLADIVAEEAGTSGNVLVATSDLTSPNQNEWIREIKKRMADKYPGLKVSAVLPTNEDPAKARQVTMDYLRAHPDTVGVICVAGGSTAGVAEAVKQLKLVGKVSATGIGVPSVVGTGLKDGSLKKVVLWNPVDLGYASVYMAHAQVKGTLDPKSGELDAGRLGKLKFVSPDEILLGDPLVFTKDNVDDFNF